MAEKAAVGAVTETPCTSDKPQRHGIAIQTHGQSMERLTLDLNVHHNYHYPERQPQQDMEGTVLVIASKTPTMQHTATDSLSRYIFINNGDDR